MDFFDNDPDAAPVRIRVTNGFKALIAQLEAGVENSHQATIARHRRAVAKGNVFWDRLRAKQEAEHYARPQSDQ